MNNTKENLEPIRSKNLPARCTLKKTKVVVQIASSLLVHRLDDVSGDGGSESSQQGDEMHSVNGLEARRHQYRSDTEIRVPKAPDAEDDWLQTKAAAAGDSSTDR